MLPITPKSRKKDQNRHFFSLFTDFFKKKSLTSKCAGYTVSRALREMAFLVREQKLKVAFSRKITSSGHTGPLPLILILNELTKVQNITIKAGHERHEIA